MVIAVNLVYTYLTRGIEDSVISRGRGLGGVIYISYLVLHTAWSTQKGMSTFYELGA